MVEILHPKSTRTQDDRIVLKLNAMGTHTQERLVGTRPERMEEGFLGQKTPSE